MVNDDTPYWLSDPTILLNKNTITQIWPLNTMSMNQKLNAITRLVSVLTILGFLVTQNYRIFITAIVTLIAISILYHFEKQQSIKKEINDSIQEGYENLSKPALDIMKYTRPTTNNPLMNVLLPQIQDNPKRESAAPAANPVIEREINQKTKQHVESMFKDPNIDEKLFKDLGDNFQFDTSMRQFYATPNTQIPNDQKSFAEFCYGDMIACKEGNELACSRSMPPQWINAN
jgi:hypothetical protein